MDSDQFGKRNTDSQFISFQDFSPINRPGAGQAQLDLGTPNHQQFINTQQYSNDSTTPGIMDELRGLPQQKEENSTSRNFWTIEYYQKFFNVNTNDVFQRIKKSMIPHGPDNYLLSHIRPNPDLYGPFWICVTLIFAIAVSGNLANYLQSAYTGQHHWRYEFHMVSYAATCICLYVWLVPMGLWAAVKWTHEPSDTSLDAELIESNEPPGLLELLCLYGYSLSIYIPTAFLWTIQIGSLQWILVGVAAILSGGVLLRSLMPLITGKQKPIYVAVILGMHLLLATGFMLYFFHVPKIAVDSVPIPESTTAMAHKIVNASNPIKNLTNSS
ncbi:protein YIPF1 [Diachasmimorpha longicaudata]|uniref:protein YIPF1 n=1 Tax=Diachasmimorpha longicaudata TaxID=58733 RepID=UPI0030B89051